jgi:predicted  nucleic acid-binding Zn-ribbon protein
MPLTAEDLQNIHRLHQQVADLRGQLELGPRRVTAIEVKLSGTEREHSDLKEQSLRTRMAADEQQLESDERKAKIADLKKKLNVCSTNKEYQSFTEEIAANDEANNELDDNLLPRSKNLIFSKHSW